MEFVLAQCAQAYAHHSHAEIHLCLSLSLSLFLFYLLTGRWKPLAYSVKRMYAPLQVQAFQDGNKIKVFLVNDRVTPVMTTVYVSLLSLDQNSTSCPSRRSLHSFGVSPVLNTDYQVQPSFASQVYVMPIETLLRTRPGCTTSSCYVSVTAVAKSGQEGAGEVSETQLWLVPLKDIDFQDPEMRLSNFHIGDSAAATVGVASLIGKPRSLMADELAQNDTQAETQTTGGRSFRSRLSSGATGPVPAQKPAKQSTNLVHGGGSSTVVRRTLLPAGTPISFTLSTNRPAAQTNLLTKFRGRFSDDAFTALHPCTPKTITFYPHVSVGPISPEEFEADLKVESLFDHQYGKPEARKAKGGAAAVAAVKPAKARRAESAAAATGNILAVETKRKAPN